MHITLISEFDAYNPDAASGALYQMSKGLENLSDVQLQNVKISIPDKFLSPLDELSFRTKQFWLRLTKGMHLDGNLYEKRARHVAEMIKKMTVNSKTDAILTALTPAVGAYLDSKIPIVYWADYVYAAIVGFYPNYRFHSPETMWAGYTITSDCLMNVKLLIFCTQWAARSAYELYGIPKNKIKVVPFGPNMEITHTRKDVKNMIRARSCNCIKILFIGKEWYRKGGDIVLQITNELHAAGHRVELTIVGCKPEEPLPSYVTCIEYFSKHSKANTEKIKKLYAESHFFFMPSRAETFGMVFCEANAFGVPCISTHVGGIPDVIRDGVNGMTFSLEATVKDYCDYMINLLNNYDQYEELALSSYNEYETRLNWPAAVLQVKNLIAEII